MRFRGIIALLLCWIVVSISPWAGAEAKAAMKKQPFGTTHEGQPIDLYTLTNKSGMEADITTYGGFVFSFKVPDRHGKFDDVVLGYDNLEGYIGNTAYFGALIGRYGNRLAHGQFTLD